MGRRKNLVWMLLAVLIVSMAVTDVGTGSPDPVVYIDPKVTAKAPGDTFEINVMVSGAVNLWLSEVFVIFDPNILEATETAKGDFEEMWQEIISNTAGIVNVVPGRPTGETEGLNGTLRLVKITFRVKAEGRSFLHLHDTVLKIPGNIRIEHAMEDGYFAYPEASYPLPLTHVVVEEHWSRNVTIESSSTISNFNFSRENKELSFDVEGPSGTIGFCDVMFWTDFIFGDYTVLLDGVSLNLSRYLVPQEKLFPDKDYRTTENATHISFYLAYYHQSTRKIQIRGTEVIPEIPEPVHDIAITNVALSPTTAEVGDIVPINVTVVNIGTFTETFNVTTYYVSLVEFPAAPLETVTDLVEKTSRTVELGWDTADVTPGRYRIKAVASSVEGEINTTNNEYIFQYVTIEEASVPIGAPTLLYAAAGVLLAVIVVGVIYYILKARRSKPT